VNEKIYIFIWFWLLFLGFLTTIVIIYRIVIVFSPYIRAFVLRLRYRQDDKVLYSYKLYMYKFLYELYLVGIMLYINTADPSEVLEPEMYISVFAHS
jgi:hypothetical protein